MLIDASVEMRLSEVAFFLAFASGLTKTRKGVGNLFLSQSEVQDAFPGAGFETALAFASK